MNPASSNTDAAPASALLGCHTSPELSLDARREQLARTRASLDVQARDRQLLYLLMLFFPIVAVLIVGAADMVFNERVGVVLVAALFVLLPFGYYRFGRNTRTVFDRCFAAGDPASAGCIAHALKQPKMPARGPYLHRLAQLTEQIGQTDWELMNRIEVAAVISYCADKDCEWVSRIGIVVARAAVEHGELRAIQPLRTARKTMLYRGVPAANIHSEVTALVENLEAQAAAIRANNLLVRPADGSPELLRVAAADRSDQTTLVRPADTADECLDIEDGSA